MPEAHQKARWMIILGLLSILGVFLILSVFSRMLYGSVGDTAAQQIEETQTQEEDDTPVNTVDINDENVEVLDYVNDDSAVQEYDPLVTVVPEGAVGGSPNPLLSDPKRGATSASVTIIEFGDFQCEACAQMSPIMAQVLAEYSDTVEHVWKDFPLPQVHQYAPIAAEAARCAQNQDAFWEYHDKLFEQQNAFLLNPWYDIAAELGLDEDMFRQCLDSGQTEELVVQGYFAAKTLELTQTPTYYINGEQFAGAMTYEELTTHIDEALQNAQTE